MFSLDYDEKNRVLRITISGIVGSEELELIDQALLEFIARQGQVRGIFDYTDVQAYSVPDSRLRQRAQQPPVMEQAKVIVASRMICGEAARAYGRHQRDAGRKEAPIVRSLEEAYTLLALRNPRFEPVER